MSLFDMTGKVALITGSSRGIGKAVAEQMAGQGAKVVISSRKAGPCEAVAGEINTKHGDGTAIAVPANISSKEDLQRLVDETNKAFGKVDVLVCNAASNPYYGPQAGISDDQFRKILDNNIVSNHWLIQMVVPQMIERKDGAIIIVSSIGGLRGSTAIGAYCISKAADMQLSEEPRPRVWAAQHPGELRCAGSGEDRFRQGAVGYAGGGEAGQFWNAAAPPRRAGRSGRIGDLSGFPRRGLDHGPDFGGGRRHNDLRLKRRRPQTWRRRQPALRRGSHPSRREPGSARQSSSCLRRWRLAWCRRPSCSPRPTGW